MQALKEAGLKQFIKFIFYSLMLIIFKICIISPLRIIFLKLLGAEIGKNTYIENIKLINLYRGSIKNLNIGNFCYLGHEILLDLAEKIIIKNYVTIAARTSIFTHINVGFENHLLKKVFPPQQERVCIENNCFIGSGTIILKNVHIHQGVFIAAGSVVYKDISSFTLAGGVPAKTIKKIKF